VIDDPVYGEYMYFVVLILAIHAVGVNTVPARPGTSGSKRMHAAPPDLPMPTSPQSDPPTLLLHYDVCSKKLRADDGRIAVEASGGEAVVVANLKLFIGTLQTYYGTHYKSIVLGGIPRQICARVQHINSVAGFDVPMPQTICNDTERRHDQWILHRSAALIKGLELLLKDSHSLDAPIVGEHWMTPSIRKFLEMYVADSLLRWRFSTLTMAMAMCNVESWTGRCMTLDEAPMQLQKWYNHHTTTAVNKMTDVLLYQTEEKWLSGEGEQWYRHHFGTMAAKAKLSVNQFRDLLSKIGVTRVIRCIMSAAINSVSNLQRYANLVLLVIKRRRDYFICGLCRRLVHRNTHELRTCQNGYRQIWSKFFKEHNFTEDDEHLLLLVQKSHGAKQIRLGTWSSLYGAMNNCSAVIKVEGKKTFRICQLVSPSYNRRAVLQHTWSSGLNKNAVEEEQINGVIAHFERIGIPEPVPYLCPCQERVPIRLMTWRLGSIRPHTYHDHIRETHCGHDDDFEKKLKDAKSILEADVERQRLFYMVFRFMKLKKEVLRVACMLLHHHDCVQLDVDTEPQFADPDILQASTLLDAYVQNPPTSLFGATPMLENLTSSWWDTGEQKCQPPATNDMNVIRENMLGHWRGLVTFEGDNTSAELVNRVANNTTAATATAMSTSGTAADAPVANVVRQPSSIYIGEQFARRRLEHERNLQGTQINFGRHSMSATLTSSAYASASASASASTSTSASASASACLPGSAFTLVRRAAAVSGRPLPSASASASSSASSSAS
jgi:hypothetical protein